MSDNDDANAIDASASPARAAADPTSYTGFDSTKYARVGKAPADAIEIISGSAVAQSFMPYFVDASDSYANQLGMAVSFHHVPSAKNIYFKAFVTAFTETYSSDWTEELVYGRADPIVLFKNTSRRVSITLNVPASSESEAYENLDKVGDLAKFLYPVYTDINDATTIGQSPLCRLKVMNILMNQKANDQLSFTNFRSNGLNWGGAGILGTISSLSINHNLDNPEIGVIEAGHGVILPKLIEVAIDFLVIHEHALGWNTSGEFSHAAFPYGTSAASSSALPAPGTQESIAAGLQRAQAEHDAQQQELVEESQEEPEEPNEAEEENWRARAAGTLRNIGSGTRNAVSAIGSGATRAYNYSAQLVRDYGEFASTSATWSEARSNNEPGASSGGAPGSLGGNSADILDS